MMQYENLIDKLIDLGLEEDINTGDVTTDSIIPESMNAVATMTAKQDGVISGIEVIKKVYERFQKDIVYIPYFKNGDSVKKGDVLGKIAERHGCSVAQLKSWNGLRKVCFNFARYVSLESSDCVLWRARIWLTTKADNTANSSAITIC